MEITTRTKIIAHVDMALFTANGQPASAQSVLFALCGHGGPDATTEPVTAATYDQATNEATVLIVGRDADDPPEGALTCPPAGAELWGRVIDNPEDDWGYVDMVEVR